MIFLRFRLDEFLANWSIWSRGAQPGDSSSAPGKSEGKHPGKPPLSTFFAHRLKRESTQHPREESDHALGEGGEFRQSEENARWESKSEEKDDEHERELKNDLTHVGEDGKERAKEGVESELVEHLDPDAAGAEREKRVERSLLFTSNLEF